MGTTPHAVPRQTGLRVVNDADARPWTSSVDDISQLTRETLRVVAEGVERPAQLDRLAQLGCDAFQGYLYSPARPPELLTFTDGALDEQALR